MLPLPKRARQSMRRSGLHRQMKGGYDETSGYSETSGYDETSGYSETSVHANEGGLL